ncbi:MAG: LysR family transcriptional regulator [Myxococcota bacterium]
MRWDDLRVLLALVREGTATRAAQHLEVHPATVYRRLEALETAMGVKVLSADGLTELGHEVFERAQRIEEEFLALQRAVTGRDEGLSGPVVLTLPESLLPCVMPIVSAFRQAHPQVVLELEAGDRMFDLARREADVALRPSLYPPEEAVGRRIATVAWTVYAPANGKGRGKGKGSGKAKASKVLPWVGYTDTLRELAAVRWWHKHHGEEDVVMAVSSVPAMVRAVAAGLGQGMLPCFAGDEDPRLRRVLPPVPEAASALWLLIHADLRRAARVRAFVDFAFPALRAFTPLFEGTRVSSCSVPKRQ